MQKTVIAGAILQSIGKGLLRYGLIVLLLWFGVFKFTETEAKAIEPLIANSPLMSWLYAVMSVAGVSRLIVAMEIALALLILLGPFSKRLLAVGGLAAVGVFLTSPLITVVSG